MQVDGYSNCNGRLYFRFWKYQLEKTKVEERSIYKCESVHCRGILPWVVSQFWLMICFTQNKYYYGIKLPDNTIVV